MFTTLFGDSWARFLGSGGIYARAGILEGVDSSNVGVGLSCFRLKKLHEL